MINIYRSVCPYDCPDTCGLMVEIEDQRVIRVKGDPDHPFTRGTLCPKMVHYERVVHAEDRLKHPLIRRGEKGTNCFEPISWKDALAIIVEKWERIINEHTAEAILPYSYAGTMGLVQRNYGDAFFHRLGTSRLLRTICNSAKIAGWAAVMGDTLAPDPAEAQQSDMIILWGTNTLATNVHLTHDLKVARDRGASVMLIETYETVTARLADTVITVKPGTDGALALGIMNYIAKERLVDQRFIDQYVLGYDQFKQHVLSDFSIEKASAFTGVPEKTIVELALSYAKAKAPFIVLGTGLSRYGNGAMTVRLITCLSALVGAWAVPGGGMLSSISTKAALPVDRIVREDFLAKETRVINMNQLGEALNAPFTPPVMGLYVYHSNPVVIAPDQQKIVEGLKRKDLFTVVHERFLTDTALYADIILPATTSVEHADIYRSYGHYCIQRAKALVLPPGEAKSNLEVFQLLADAFGFSEPFFQQSAEELIDRLLEPPRFWLEEEQINQLNEGKPVALPLPENYKMQFRTPSGKIELYNKRLQQSLPDFFEAYGGDETFFLMSTPHVFTLNSSFNELESLVKKKELVVLMNPHDAKNNDIKEGQWVTLFNERGSIEYPVKVSDRIPPNVLVIEGLSWGKIVGKNNFVNALTSQRLTDCGEASTLYDVKVNLKKIEKNDDYMFIKERDPFD